MKEHKVTPLMQQYFAIRDQYPDALLLFQVGDFYEFFFDDAKTVSAFLGIALTKRGKSSGVDIPLCGIPVHALKHYLIKLVKGGFKIAVCDQLTEPKPGTIVERGVTQVYTPGTLIDDQMLDQKSASYLLSFYPMHDQWGLIFGEILTAQLFATSFAAGSFRHLESELARFFPDEIIVPALREAESFSHYFKQHGFWVSNALPHSFDSSLQEELAPSFFDKFDGSSQEIFSKRPVIKNGVGLLYSYLSNTHKSALNHFNSVQFYKPHDYVYLDYSTVRNLEIVKNNNDFSRNDTLLSVVDHACTSMGSRMLKKWLTRPLLHHSMIAGRQEFVSFLKSNVSYLQQSQEILSSFADIERIVGRIALGRASLNDYLLLKSSLRFVPAIAELLHHASCDLAQKFLTLLYDFSSLVTLLENSLEEQLGAAHSIKKGFDEELDRLRELVENAQQRILKLEEQEIEKTGIDSLKIRFNKIMGYAIEITKTHLSKVPSYYIRQQTLTNRERFVTPELLELEREIAQAQNTITPVENAVLERVKKEVENHLPFLRKTAYAIASIDALYSFAHVAYEHNYVLPSFNENRDIIIKGGRHCVIEQKREGAFVPNDTTLTDEQSLWIITGPNMGGKSTYLRQVAHMCLLAQCGSFVPATQASLPLVDRIFTRIGAGDNLAEGKSTFLVEMEETALICNQATHNSLVILDEVGRGTSTFDGLAIAQAVIEYIYSSLRARCLFATHYHELTSLSATFSGIANYHMASKKSGDSIVFLHTIVPGSAQGSFGLEVAKLAELPKPIIDRARIILSSLTHAEITSSQMNVSFSSQEERLQELIARQEKILSTLKATSLDDLSPREALNFLWDLKTQLLSEKKKDAI